MAVKVFVDLLFNKLVRKIIVSHTRVFITGLVGVTLHYIPWIQS
jgi:hypothetical protein